MKLKITTAVMMVAAVQITSVLATTVNFSNAPATATRFADSGGSLLPDGNLVLIGRLATPGNYGSFEAFANGAIGTLGGSLPGFATTGATNNAADAFNDSEIFLWVYAASTADPAADQAIFNATGAGGGQPWVFPTNTGTGTDAVTIDIAAIDPTGMAYDPTTGGLSPIVSGPAAGAGVALNLFPAIPEPSTGILSLLGFAGLLLMRRRS